jgi:hypothetical protein
MQENKAQIPFYTSLKERGPQSGKIGPNERRIRLNTNQIKSNHFIFSGTHMDALKRSKGVDPLKIEPKGHSGGAAAPLVALFGPKLHRLPLTIFPWSVQVGMSA